MIFLKFYTKKINEAGTADVSKLKNRYTPTRADLSSFQKVSFFLLTGRSTTQTLLSLSLKLEGIQEIPK